MPNLVVQFRVHEPPDAIYLLPEDLISTLAELLNQKYQDPHFSSRLQSKNNTRVGVVKINDRLVILVEDREREVVRRTSCPWDTVVKWARADQSALRSFQSREEYVAFRRYASDLATAFKQLAQKKS